MSAVFGKPVQIFEIPIENENSGAVQNFEISIENENS